MVTEEASLDSSLEPDWDFRSSFSLGLFSLEVGGALGGSLGTWSTRSVKSSTKEKAPLMAEVGDISSMVEASI